MASKNVFSDTTREQFIFNTTCWWCGMSHVSCLHHILGRVSSSPLNAAPLSNFGCHIGNGKLSRFDVKKKLLKKTLDFLLKSDYRLTKEDKLFMEKNSKYYEQL